MVVSERCTSEDMLASMYLCREKHLTKIMANTPKYLIPFKLEMKDHYGQSLPGLLMYQLKLLSSFLMQNYLVPFIHSFIHSGYLYSASSRNLLRGAPSPATAKQKGLE